MSERLSASQAGRGASRPPHAGEPSASYAVVPRCRSACVEAAEEGVGPRSRVGQNVGAEGNTVGTLPPSQVAAVMMAQMHAA